MPSPAPAHAKPAALAVTPRGPLSEAVLAAWSDDDLDPARAVRLADDALTGPDASGGAAVFHDDDVQLALFLLYAPSYGWGPRPELEFDPGLLALRARLEAAHEAALRTAVGPLPDVAPTGIAAALFEMTAPSGPPRLASTVKRKATVEQLRELMVLRSIYHLREADPHSWAIPRLTGRAKAALVEIQSDEYGNGRFASMHSSLFAEAMRGVGLTTEYGAYLDAVPAVVLAWHSTMSLFGLNSRLVGAIVGHLAAYEMTSTTPNMLMRDGFERVGHGPEVWRFFDEHVLADAAHEQVAAHDLAGGLAVQEPAHTSAILFGAASSLRMDDLVADHILGAWEEGRSALRVPLTAGGEGR